MGLSDIFSRAFFRTPEERKAAALEKFDDKLARLTDYRIDDMLESSFARAEEDDTTPKPIKIEMTFRDLAPGDITAADLEDSGNLEFLHYLAEEAEARLTFEVTGVKSRTAFLWKDDDAPQTYARVTIVIDPGQPYSESRVVLADGTPPQAARHNPLLDPPSP